MMLLRKAYRFRIYPDATQEELFRRTIGFSRLVYNLCLDQKILERERSRPRKLSAYDQMKELTALKEECEFLYEVPNHPLQQAIHDLHKAFVNFFEGRASFPTFRKKGQNGSFRYPDSKQVMFEEDRIFLPKAGWTRIVMHRPIVGRHRLRDRGRMVRVGADGAGSDDSGQPRSRRLDRPRKRSGDRFL